MNYTCRNCGRTLGCEESIFFCPFCGAAYASGQAPETRIVIAADGGRTVQEQYWYSARGAILETLGWLRTLIPGWDDDSDQAFDLEDWCDQQSSCASAAQFKRRCDALIKSIAETLRSGNVEKTVEPTDIQSIAAQLALTGNRLAEAIGEGAALNPPELSYSPVSDAPRAQSADAWEPLFQAVEHVLPRLYAVIDEYGLYAARSALKKLPEKCPKRDLQALGKRLCALAEADFDPLFGESCDEFASAFWESVQQLANLANISAALPEQDQNERAKRDALNDYIVKWKDELTMSLDRAYQSGKIDMLAVYEKASQICAETKEACKREED